MIIAVVADLIFESKVAGAARAVGVDVACCRSAEAALARLAEATAFVIDLTVDIESMLGLIRSIKAERPATTVIAFLPHVLTEQFDQAREAGADEAMARSAFNKRLPEILKRLTARETT